MQPQNAHGVCELEQRLMRGWSSAVEDFSRVISILTGSAERSPQHHLLRAEAEAARLHLNNTHVAWQFHCRDHGCSIASADSFDAGRGDYAV
jgi:hypothetical protein